METVTRCVGLKEGTAADALQALSFEIKVRADRPANPRDISIAIYWKDDMLIAEGKWTPPEGAGNGLLLPPPSMDAPAEEREAWATQYCELIGGYHL